MRSPAAMIKVNYNRLLVSQILTELTSITQRIRDKSVDSVDDQFFTSVSKDNAVKPNLLDRKSGQLSVGDDLKPLRYITKHKYRLTINLVTSYFLITQSHFTMNAL